MEIHPFVFFVFLLIGINEGDTLAIPAIPAPVSTLLQMAWAKVNPSTMDIEIKKISKSLDEMKTKLEKLEHAVIFGQDIKTIEYLIEKFNTNNKNNNSQFDKEMWAMTAIENGSDGFDKSLKSLGEMMDGTSKIFAEGSIFEVIAKDKNGNEGTACANSNIEEAWDYLIGLWTVGHAVWARAYNIKNQNFQIHAKELERKARSKLGDFEQAKDMAYPDHCNCFQKGVFYFDLDHLTNPSKNSYTNVITARLCQSKCNETDNCLFWTFHKDSSKCFIHEHDNHKSTADDEDEVISGPKVCPMYWSFCCGLGYWVSVLVALVIVLISIIGMCCCCVMVCKEVCD